MSHDELKRRVAEQREKEKMSEPTELLPLAKSLYNVFKDRKGLEWMGPFEAMSYSRQENWFRVAKEVRNNRWAAFSDEDLDEIIAYLPSNDLSQEIESELTRRSEIGAK
jgi:hypothetical protein